MVSDSDRLGVEVVVENCHIVFQSRLTGAWTLFSILCVLTDSKTSTMMYPN